MGKRELIALLNLSSWCLVMVERLFLAVPQGCLQFVIVVFPDINIGIKQGFSHIKSSLGPEGAVETSPEGFDKLAET